MCTHMCTDHVSGQVRNTLPVGCERCQKRRMHMERDVCIWKEISAIALTLHHIGSGIQGGEDS